VSEHLPVILVELVLVFGGVLAFGWWQLRSVSRDREALAARRRAEAARQAAASSPQPDEKSDTVSGAGSNPLP
jgi:hypothetical protein